jgi:hypothetical protein
LSNARKLFFDTSCSADSTFAGFVGLCPKL